MHAPHSVRKVRIGIIGVGNCANSLVQGLSYYREAVSNEPVPGLMNANLGGYHVRDIELSAAFDVSAEKVGKDLADAIWAAPNNTHRFADVAPTGVTVQRGHTLDGIGQYLRDDIELSDEEEADVTSILARSHTDVVVSYLPVGSQKATEWYAERALEAGCGFVNCIPVFIASNPHWRARFESAGLPIVGDDIKSQVGATIVHRILANLFRERGVRLDRTYQLNVGGNADFKNMLERERLKSKKISKTQAVTSQFDVPLEADNVHVGPSDHVPWLTDRKVAFIRLEGTAFGGVPLSAELRLEVWDSPNSAGVVIDAVRCAKLAMDRGIGGALIGPSSYFMKSPPRQFTDDEARDRTCRFIKGDD
jgi:myo-inositol-1-phosphate synthase